MKVLSTVQHCNTLMCLTVHYAPQNFVTWDTGMPYNFRKWEKDYHKAIKNELFFKLVRSIATRGLLKPGIFSTLMQQKFTVKA